MTGAPLVALLLSGGAGQRLWPLSTEENPKQFLKLFGERSLFQMTLDRLSAIGAPDLVVVANVRHENFIVQQLEPVFQTVTLVMEPLRRDSAAAIAAGVKVIVDKFGEEAMVAVLPCDHLIADTSAFAGSLNEAAELASLNRLVAFGIKPTHPSTEFGYIQRGERISGHASGFSVKKFHEKPTAPIATGYLQDGGYDWNSGIFVFRAGLFVSEATMHMPEIVNAASDAVRTGSHDSRRFFLDQDAFAQARRTSIDYALFEKSSLVGVVPASFPWSDVGSWAAVFDAHDKDKDFNASAGDAILRDSSRTLAIGLGVKVVTLGLNDLVVVASPNGVFVAPRSRASEIKNIIGG